MTGSCYNIPLCDDCGNKTSHEPRAVKEHVETEIERTLNVYISKGINLPWSIGWSKAAPVWNKAQGVGPDPVEELDEGEGEVEEEEAEEVPGVRISKDEADPVALHNCQSRFEICWNIFFFFWKLTAISFHFPRTPRFLPRSSCLEGSILAPLNPLRSFSSSETIFSWENKKETKKEIRFQNTVFQSLRLLT